MTNRIIMGDLGSGTYGLKVSKSGIDVLTAGQTDLMFDSSSIAPRVLMTGSCATSPANSNSRSRVNNVVVSLPVLDYEPIVFCGFIYRVTTSVGGGVPDPLAGKFYSSLWMSGIYNANPKDYIKFKYDSTANTMTFDGLTARPEIITGSDWGHLPTFRYLIFSHKAN